MRVRYLWLALIALAVQVSAGAVAAPAATAAPRLALHTLLTPTDFLRAPCGEEGPPACNRIALTVTNVSAEPTIGAITIRDTLPPGLAVHSIEFGHFTVTKLPEFLDESACPQTGSLVKCRFASPLAPDSMLQLRIGVEVEPGAQSGELNSAVLSGGGAPEVSEQQPDLLDAEPAFGLSAFASAFTAPGGEPEAQAGGHPYELLTRFDLNNVVRSVKATGIEELRDAVVDLPPGLAGSAEAAPKCRLSQLATNAGCPTDTRVGLIYTEPEGFASASSAVYNMVPEHGVTAQFGFTDALHNVHFIYSSVVPTGGGYVVRATSPEVPQIRLTDAIVTFFGDPATKNGSSGESHPPMFTLPSDCSGQALETEIHADSWQNPAPYNPDGSPDLSEPRWASAASKSPPVTGCDQLRFEPTIEASPETNRADSPTGLDVTLKVPQTEEVGQLATPPLKKAVVTLPQGMSVNPSSANGLEGCSLAEIGISPSGQPDAAAPSCPAASRIGTVELLTPAVEGDPALGGALQGDIYVAKQTENPFGTLLAIYIAVDDPYTGVTVKLPGEVRADPVTGQLSTVVDNSPQFPFSELRTHFFGGQRAALRTPATCGTYKVTSQLTPWSAPASGPPATPSSSFKIASSANGEPCPGSDAARPNSPSFSAGTRDPLAASYSPFALHLARADGSQEIGSLTLAMPPGLTGKLAGIAECPEAALAAAAAKSGREELASPSCPEGSKVGTVSVAAGAGLDPYNTSGTIYLAGPYKGAPLSLAIVTPAVAGPYDLGDVVVRSVLQVDPETARITAVSDPIPHILQGIPLDVRSIALEVGRPSFILNPSNCERFAISGVATSTLGQSAQLSSPFQVGGCAKLGFKPHLKLSLKGKVRRTAHPRLVADLTYPKGGAYANIARAQVKLPPAAFLDQGHLGNICTKVQFAEGQKLGEKCPSTSIYGRARAVTPLLDAPLEGPVYLRSGLAGHVLPDLVAALNGQISVALVGKTDSVHAALRNTFEAVPDAPVSSFHLELFGGKKGLIVMSDGFCKRPRATVKFTAQNGKVLETRPKVAAKCPKGKGGKAKKGRR